MENHPLDCETSLFRLGHFQVRKLLVITNRMVVNIHQYPYYIWNIWNHYIYMYTYIYIWIYIYISGYMRCLPWTADFFHPHLPMIPGEHLHGAAPGDPAATRLPASRHGLGIQRRCTAQVAVKGQGGSRLHQISRYVIYTWLEIIYMMIDSLYTYIIEHYRLI